MSNQIKRLRQNLGLLLRNRAFSAILLLAATVLMLSHFITARNLLIINDGDSFLIVDTYENNVNAAIAQTGIQVSSLSSVSLPEAQFESGVSTVTIDRTYSVTVHSGTNIIQVRTEGESVGDILTRLGIEVGTDDQIVPALTELTTPNMNISVVRVSYTTVEETEALPFGSSRVANNKLAKGKENVKQQGVEGEKKLTYSVTLRNGMEVERTLVSEEITVEPIEHIVEYGTYVKPTASYTTVTGGGIVEGGIANYGQGGGTQYTSKYSQGSGVIKDTGGTITLADGTVLEYTRVLDMKATAYTSEGAPSNAVTALGTKTYVGVVAVDPRVIPLKTRLYIVGSNGAWSYGMARAEDVGGAVKGYIVDVFFPTKSQVNSFGRRSCTVYVLK